MNEIIVPKMYFEMKAFQCSVLRIPFFYELNSFRETKGDPISRMRSNDSNFFVKKKEREVNENIWRGSEENEHNNEIIENKVSFIRQILRLSGGSNRHTFFRMTSDNCVEIDDSIDVIERADLIGLESLKEVRFSSRNHLIEIDGFEHCLSLCRIDIPPSVRKIGSFGFNGCTSLNIGCSTQP
jgi:hypothetical protein